jgi:predicted nucleic acid-binding protein
MFNNLPIYYWDACVMLSYINGHAARTPHIEGLLERSGKEFQIITSVFSITEVSYGLDEQLSRVLDPGVKARISRLWEVGSPIYVVEFYRLLAERASTLMRDALPKSWSLKPSDAIHLATADHYKVAQFHTYDDRLTKFSEITENRVTICTPIASQSVMALSTDESDSSSEILPSPGL